MGATLDKIDLRILRTLQEKGKITNILLSKEVGLSPAPTLERVKKLENANFIRSYHASVDPSQLGLGFTALIQVSLSRQRDNAINSFRDKIVDIEEIVECYQLTGDFDYQIKVMVKDIPAFDSLISDKLSTIDEIGQMKTMVVLSKIKDSKVLPITY